MTRHDIRGGVSDLTHARNHTDFSTTGGSMSIPAREFEVIEGDYQPTLTIEFPRAKETYKVTSPPLKTDMALTPRMKVKVVGYGYLAKIKGDFLGEENKREWTVVLDEVELSE